MEIDKDMPYMIAITSNYIRLLEILIPIPLLDAMEAASFLPHSTLRDIREASTTSEMNRQILARVRSKGPENFNQFLLLLRSSGNEFVADMLVGTMGEARSTAEYKDLQTVLMKHYRNTCLTVQNPLENDDIGLEYIYVEPEIRVLRQSKGRDGLRNVKEEASAISCRRLFYTGDYMCTQIYVTGDAGTGKSVLCKNLVRLWCESHDEFSENETGENDSEPDDDNSSISFTDTEEERTQLRKKSQEERHKSRKKIQDERKIKRDDDKQIMQQFTLLFYLTLRDSLSEYSVSDMIQSQILQHYDSVKGLCTSVLLKTCCCLVIVDGLDEWTCPKDTVVPHFVNCGIPGRDVSNESNVVLTTTRPWKFDVLELKSSEVDKHVELCELNETSATQLCSKVVKILNKTSASKKKIVDFFRTLEQQNLCHFQTIPVILIQLVCLWFDNHSLGTSRVQLYCAMLDLLMKKAQKNLSTTKTKTQKHSSAESLLIKCFTDHSYCQENLELIQCLSKVAFETLFDTRKENSLVFRTSQMKMFGLEQESISACLKSGILSQNKVLEKCSISEKKMSFLHKTFQEFLAALFIASYNPKDIFKRITSFCTTLDICLDMSQVWLFVSGIRPDITRRILEHMHCIVSADTRVQRYRQILDGEGLVRDIQACITACLTEGENNGYTYDKISLQDFYINESTVCRVKPWFSPQTSKIKSLFKRLSHTDRSNIRSVHICIGTVSVHEIIEQLQRCRVLQKLHLRDPFRTVPPSTLTDILNNNCNTLTCLQLYSGITCTEEFLSAVCICITKHLTALDIFNIKLTHEHKTHILKTISQSPTIRELGLELHCTDHGKKCTAGIDLSSMVNSHRLVLCEQSVENLQAVSHCVNELSLCVVTLPRSVLCDFAKAIARSGRDVKVEMYDVSFTETSDNPIQMDIFFPGCDGLVIRKCQYNDKNNTWSVVFHTCS